jgi:hypothetical protein
MSVPHACVRACERICSWLRQRFVGIRIGRFPNPPGHSDSARWLEHHGDPICCQFAMEGAPPSWRQFFRDFHDWQDELE